MTILVAVETGNMNQVFVSRISNVGGIDIGSRGGVFPKSLSSLFLVILSYLYVFWIKTYQSITYLELKIIYWALNFSRTIPNMITIKFDCPM